MKKVTMKDIAQRAGVSVATVSYVLNRVDNQTIPDKTRTQILQIAEELHYIPNLAARSLVNQKTGLVGILVNRTEDMPFWKLHSHAAFIQELEFRLTCAGYHALLYTLDAQQPSLDVILERKLEAAFLVDVREESFYSISRHFVEGVPLILIDSLIDDPLFKQVNFDFESALHPIFKDLPEKACLITESFNNALLLQYIRESAPLPGQDIFEVRNWEELDAVLARGEYDEAVVINEFIGNQAEKAGIFKRLSVVCTCGCPELLGPRVHTSLFERNKADEAFRLMKELLDGAVPSENRTKNRYFVS